MDDDRQADDPSPEAIREHCLRIQAAWSDVERIRRANFFCKRHVAEATRQWTAPEVETPIEWT